jgi:hypothetical protein
MYLEISPEVSSIRVYSEPDGYAKRLPYLGMMTITYLNSKIVYVHGARGIITRATYDQALALLKSLGIQEVKMERHGKMKSIYL